MAKLHTSFFVCFGWVLQSSCSSPIKSVDNDDCHKRDNVTFAETTAIESNFVSETRPKIYKICVRSVRDGFHSEVVLIKLWVAVRFPLFIFKTKGCYIFQADGFFFVCVYDCHVAVECWGQSAVSPRMALVHTLSVGDPQYWARFFFLDLLLLCLLLLHLLLLLLPAVGSCGRRN